MTRLHLTFSHVYLIHCLPGDVGHGSVYENILLSREKKYSKEFCLFTSLARSIFKATLLASQSKILPSHWQNLKGCAQKKISDILTTLFNWNQFKKLFAISRIGFFLNFFSGGILLVTEWSQIIFKCTKMSCLKDFMAYIWNFVNFTHMETVSFSFELCWSVDFVCHNSPDSLIIMHGKVR